MYIKVQVLKFLAKSESVNMGPLVEFMIWNDPPVFIKAVRKGLMELRNFKVSDRQGGFSQSLLKWFY